MGAEGKVISERLGSGKHVAFSFPVHDGDKPFQVAHERKEARNPLHTIRDEYLLPKGYPESVTPQYAKYMSWRGAQYFFGGAIGVYTTNALIRSVGVSASQAAASSAALQWVVKDGAGRAGRFLFARWGKNLDGDLKQYRLLGDCLMFGGAVLELCTAAMPKMFLPLACAANLSKNLAAVAMSATRAPIYRSFALNNNMADITAKGESVANIADLVGTAVGLTMHKFNAPPPLVFAILSLGYLTASRNEVDAVELPYYNRARLALAAREFLASGVVPNPTLVNAEEPLAPWADHGQDSVRLGSSLSEAFCSWGATEADVRKAVDLFRDRAYMLTVAPSSTVHVVLREMATNDDILEAAFMGHVVLHRLEQRESTTRKEPPLRLPTIEVPVKFRRMVQRIAPGTWKGSKITVSKEDAEDAIEWAKKAHGDLYKSFVTSSKGSGWKVSSSRLNSRDVRVHLEPMSLDRWLNTN